MELENSFSSNQKVVEDFMTEELSLTFKSLASAWCFAIGFNFQGIYIN